MTHKVVLTGNRGVGKTSYLYRLITGRNVHTPPTRGFKVHTLAFPTTTRGIVFFTVWDMAGEKVDMRTIAYVGASAFIVFYIDPDTIAPWVDDVTATSGPVTVLRVCTGTEPAPGDMVVSTFKYLGMMDPFLHLARVLEKDPLLEFLPF